MTIEEIICGYLHNKLDVVALPEKPNRPYDGKVFVQRTSGSGQHIRETTVAIQSYGESMYKAATLNDQVIATMYGIIELDSIIEISLNSNYEYSDTDSKEYRYQAVFDITHY